MLEQLLTIRDAIQVRDWTRAMAIATAAVEQMSVDAGRNYEPGNGRKSFNLENRPEKRVPEKEVEIGLYGP